MIHSILDIRSWQQSDAEPEFSSEEEREKEKNRLWDELENLFWREPAAYMQLCNFCKRDIRLDAGVKTLLIEKGLLRDDGSIPTTTNEVVYEATTGRKPFWLRDDDGCLYKSYGKMD